MPSINLDVNYRRHPKTKRLVARLGKGAEAIPVWLWSYCGEFHAATGEISGITPEDLESEIGWRGNRGECIKALEEEGFLEPLERGWRVHDFIERNGHIHAYHVRAKKARAAQLGKLAGPEPPPSSPAKPATSRATSPALAIQRDTVQSPLPPKGGEGVFLDRPEVRKRWDAWVAMRRKRFRAGEAEACVAFLESLGGDQAAVACLQDAIDNGLIQLRRPQTRSRPPTLEEYAAQRRAEAAKKQAEEETARRRYAAAGEKVGNLVAAFGIIPIEDRNGVHEP